MLKVKFDNSETTVSCGEEKFTLDYPVSHQDLVDLVKWVNDHQED